MPFHFARKPEPEAKPQPTKGDQSDSPSIIQPNDSSHAQGSLSQGNNNNRNNSDNSNNSSSPALLISGTAADGKTVSSNDSAHLQTIAPQPEPEPETDSESEESTEQLVHLHTKPSAVKSLTSLSRYFTLLLKFHRKQQRCVNSRKPKLPNPDPAQSRSGELDIYLSPLIENVFINFKKLITEGIFKEEDVPTIMTDITTIWLPEGAKWAASIRKLQEMQLEWFDLRFGEYAGFTGLSTESHARRENLGRLTGRKDAIFVDALWLDPPPEPLDWKSDSELPSAEKLQTTDQPQPQDRDSNSHSKSTKKLQTPMILFTQALFDRSSWDTVLSILEREEIDKNSLPCEIVKQEGPMTTLIRLLACHANDTLTNVRSIISDYVTRRHPSHLQNQLSLKDLVRKGHYFDLAGRLAADLAMIDHLPQAIDKGWGPLLHDKLVRIINYHFKQFDVHGITGALLTYSPRLPGEHPRTPGPYWRLAPPRPTLGQFLNSAEDEVDAATGRFHEPKPRFGPFNIWETRGDPNTSGQPSTGRRIPRENGYIIREGRLQPAWPALRRQPMTPPQSSAWPALGSQESTPRQLPKEVRTPAWEKNEQTGKDTRNGN